MGSRIASVDPAASCIAGQITLADKMEEAHQRIRTIERLGSCK
jgi:hypothetical protein